MRAKLAGWGRRFGQGAAQLSPAEEAAALARLRRALMEALARLRAAGGGGGGGAAAAEGEAEDAALLELVAARARLEGGVACLEAMERARPRGPHLTGQAALLRLQLGRLRTPPPRAPQPEAEAAAAAAAAAALESWHRATGALLVLRSRASRESATLLQWLHLRRLSAQRPSLLLRERGAKDGIRDKRATRPRPHPSPSHKPTPDPNPNPTADPNPNPTANPDANPTANPKPAP